MKEISEFSIVSLKHSFEKELNNHNDIKSENYFQMSALNQKSFKNWIKKIIGTSKNLKQFFPIDLTF